MSTIATPAIRPNASKMDYIHLRSHSNLRFLSSRLEAQAYGQTQQLIVVCPGCEPDWRSPEVTSLFRAFTHVTRLQELKLNCVGLLDVPFPLRLLQQVIESCPSSLRSLELDDVALSGVSPAEVTDLAQAMERKAASGELTQFRVFGCLADDTLHSGCLDPLWSSTAGLRRVELDAVDDGLLGSIQAATVGRLVRSQTLEHFHLNGFALDNDCLVELADALQHNTSLVDLSFDLYSVGHPGQGGFALAEALRGNQHLKRLHLSISHAWNDEDFLQALAQALTTDCTLESLIIGTCAVIRDSTAQAFCEMMAQNCTLQQLQLSRYNGEWKPLLVYYVSLNSRRRGYFHANYGTDLPRWEWVEGLIQNSGDLDALYYFIHMNPSLYCGEVDSS